MTAQIVAQIARKVRDTYGDRPEVRLCHTALASRLIHRALEDPVQSDSLMEAAKWVGTPRCPMERGPCPLRDDLCPFRDVD